MFCGSRIFGGMVGQMNETGRQKRPRQRTPPGPYGSFTRPSPAIPCRVASPQSPTPTAKPEGASGNPLENKDEELGEEGVRLHRPFLSEKRPSPRKASLSGPWTRRRCRASP